ncbi:MAG: hypothetical protein JWO83_1367, partial [Caulobacteraceae bacterium]|nr:hypothetical protein [Caulobacteraceae bacterium]
GGLYEVVSASQFWAVHAVLVGLGGVLMLLMGARLKREFADGAEHPMKAASEPTKAGSQPGRARLSASPPAR